MHEHSTPAEPTREPDAGHPAHRTSSGTPEPSEIPDEARDMVELRMELDLAQLDHPSRWAKLSRLTPDGPAPA